MSLFSYQVVTMLCLGLVLATSTPAVAADKADDAIAALLTSNLPERQAPASFPLGGRAFLAEYYDTSIPVREKAVVGALNRGFFPDFLRTMRAVTIRGKGHSLTFWVMPDYVSIGSNDDFVLMPLSFVSARKLANDWGFVLPTPKMVDAIFRQADSVIWPRIFRPAPAMVSVAWLEAHNDLIQSQRFGERDLSRLAAGHKKDIVLSSRLKNRDKKIAIYGWQNIRAGENIQPLSTWHGEHYVDYSHGLRLVGAWGLLDGKLLPMKTIMADEALSSLVSDEGPIPVDRLLNEPAEALAQP